MTLVLAWREAELDRLWLVSDSRLTAPIEQGGTVRLSDSGGKLLEIDQILLDSRIPPPRPVVTRNTLIFAYAGSSLIAFQTYTAVQALWSKLLNPNGCSLPSVLESARYLSKFVGAYFRELGAAGQRCDFEGFLAGYCPTERQLVGCRIRPRVLDDEVEVDVHCIDISPGRLHAFGSRAELADQLAQEQPPTWRREPLHFLRKQLSDDQHLDIGGGMQIGFIEPNRVDVAFDAPFCPMAAFENHFRYRGFPFDEIMHIGPCQVGMAGVSG